MSETDFQHVRKDTRQLGSFRLIRDTFVHHGGELRQEMQLLHGDLPLASTEWVLAPRGSFDGALKALDAHWDRLGKETQEIMEQAQFYRFIKQRGGERGAERYVAQVLRGVGSMLLYQNIPDAECHQGRCEDAHFPLVPVGSRLCAMRNVCANENVKKEVMDRYEKALFSLHFRMCSAIDSFDDAMEGHGKEGYQGTADDPQREDWHGDQHHAQTDFGVAPKWQPPEHADGEDKLVGLFQRFDGEVMKFSDAANRLWMEAVQQVTEGRPVVQNNAELSAMREHMGRAIALRREMVEDMRDSGMGYEFQEFSALMGDPEKNVDSRMQQVVAIAARPAQLEREIKKGLVRSRGME